MNKILKIILILIICNLCLPLKVKAQDVKPGYSPWNEYPTGDPYEESTIQYGRKVPVAWSDWSSDNPSSFTKDFKVKDGGKKYYAYNNEGKFWSDVNAKSLYTWDFGYMAKVIYAYIDVDTYRSPNYDNYQAPPLQLYCDGRQIASIGTHDVLQNWNPSINHSCRYLELKMSNNAGGGKNRTMIVGTWVTTSLTLYSYVTKWSEGQDWRFDKPYERIYGENPQIPTERKVYSHPLKYRINYELDGGTFLQEPTYEYTVNDEVSIPSVTKKGYDFIGFVDSKGNTVSKIEKGSYGDITLRATYKRRAPTLYISYTYFDCEDKKIPFDELLKRVNAKAIDELDGDISEKIKVSQIVYYPSNYVDDNPDSLDISKAGYVDISFYVVNSGDESASLTRRYYILNKGEKIDDQDVGIQIYPRYITEDFKQSLQDDSIWKEEAYADALAQAYQKYREN